MKQVSVMRCVRVSGWPHNLSQGRRFVEQSIVSLFELGWLFALMGKLIILGMFIVR